MENENIKNLREALKFSPDNIPLRKLLADTLYNHGMFSEAEKEYKSALQIDSLNLFLKLGLAKSFYQLKKIEAAHIVVEELADQECDDAEFFVLHARILFEKGHFKEAKDEYNKGVFKNKLLIDKVFEENIDKSLTTSGQGVKIPLGGSEEEFDFAEKDIEKPRISFKDVGGMDKLKEEIAMKVIHPLKNPEIYKAYGKKIGGGILMYGPPGCGKTHLARATAGEIQASFISVGINDVLDMWMGNSEKNLHEIFQQARRNAPCVLFFDEVDALGASRSDMRRSEGRFLINQFLNELDGIEYSNEGVLVLGATNSPWYLDNAFRRPGRFDRVIFVQPPDSEARVSILDLLLKDKPVENLDLPYIAKKTEEFSGADLKALIDIAIEAKITESIKRNAPVPLNTQDFKNAINKHKPTTKEWFSTAKNYALYSNEGGLYDDILVYLKLKK